MQVDRAVGVAGRGARDHVGHRNREGATRLRLLQRDQRVGRLAGLGEDDVERAVADRRAAVAKLRRVLRPRRDAGPVLDHVLADHRGVQRRSHPEEQDVLDGAEPFVGDVELPEGNDAVVGKPAASCIGHGLGRLVDLLEHEVRESALLRLGDVPVDVHHLRLHGHAVEGRDLRSERGDRGHLALAEDEHSLGVRDDGRDVRGDVVLVLAQADDQRRVEPRADQELGVVAREHGQRVGAFDALQRGTDGGQEVALVVGLDEVGNDLGVGVGGKLVAGGLQLRLELGEVLDDAVVDDEDLAVAVGVRVGVDVGRLAVGGPARMPDAEPA